MQISTRMMEAVNGKRNYHGGDSERGEGMEKEVQGGEVVNMANEEEQDSFISSYRPPKNNKDLTMQ